MEGKKMKIGIIGTGRLGISFSLLCEKNGYEIIASDIRQDYIDNLNNKTLKTNEPQIESLLKNSNNLYATTDNSYIIKNTSLIYSFVATPSLSDGSYDTQYLYSVVNDIKKYTDKSKKFFVIGCTINPGDSDNIQNILFDYNVSVIYNPEFIAQGSIIKDLEQADMVLIGSKDSDANIILKNIYSKIQITKPKFNIMSPKAAEICKIALNCFLTTKISYANMIGQILISSNLEEEIKNVLTAIGDDTRVGKKYLNFGFGFGGPCLPRDNRALGAYAESIGIKTNMALNVDNFNNEHAEYLKKYLIKQNSNLNIPFFIEGISYKNGTDIMTDSQQYKLCLDLLESGYSVYIKDNENVINQVKEYLLSKYFNQVFFIFSKQELPEKYYEVKL